MGGLPILTICSPSTEYAASPLPPMQRFITNFNFAAFFADDQFKIESGTA
jgi:hypothetical protein